MTYPKTIEYSLRYPALQPSGQEYESAKRAWLAENASMGNYWLFRDCSGFHKIGPYAEFFERQANEFDQLWKFDHPTNQMTTSVRTTVVFDAEDEATMRESIENSSLFNGWLA